MYNDNDMKQAYNEGYERGKADGGYAVLSEGWRDVRKELPEEFKCVLGWSKFGVYYIIKLEKGFWFDDSDTRQNISFWRPLPEPPAFA